MKCPKCGYNNYFLTPTELLVAELLAFPNKIIASELNITEGTIKTHVTHIQVKTNSTNRTEVLLKLVREGVLIISHNTIDNSGVVCKIFTGEDCDLPIDAPTLE